MGAGASAGHDNFNTTAVTPKSFSTNRSFIKKYPSLKFISRVNSNRILPLLNHHEEKLEVNNDFKIDNNHHNKMKQHHNHMEHDDEISELIIAPHQQHISRSQKAREEFNQFNEQLGEKLNDFITNNKENDRIIMENDTEMDHE